jgi:hypothetical protein
LELFERVRTNGGGDANLLTAFLDPDDFPPALQANGAFRIDVFQDESELYKLPGEKERSVSKNTPRAAEIPCDTFAGFKFHGQFASVTRLPALLRFFHGLSSGVWLRYSVAITETPYAPRDIFFNFIT